jgi:hypothetical protein
LVFLIGELRYTLSCAEANYIIGSLPALKRFFLHFKGISGDKRGGIQQFEIAAARGRYLRPFAKILLAMAALREKNPKTCPHSTCGTRRGVSGGSALFQGASQARFFS